MDERVYEQLTISVRGGNMKVKNISTKLRFILDKLRVSHIYVEWKLWFTVASELVLSSTFVCQLYSVNIYKQRLRYYGYKDTQYFQLITVKYVTIVVVTTVVTLLLLCNCNSSNK